MEPPVVPLPVVPPLPPLGVGVVEVSVESEVVVSVSTSGVVGTWISAGLEVFLLLSPPPLANTATTTIRKMPAASAATRRRRK